MKNVFYVLVIFASIGSQAQSLKTGDNIKKEFKKSDKLYYFSAPTFTEWTEASNMIIISSQPNMAEADFVFLALKDTTLIGAFKTSEPYYFLLDTEGNSILGEKSETFLLPAWTVKNKTKINKKDKSIVTILDKIYQKTLQADDLELDEKTMNEYLRYFKDTSLPNRHIALMFENYQTIINESAAKGERPPAEICVPLMTTLSKECLSIFNSIPVIVSIYMGEAYQSAGMIDKARDEFKRALVVYPNSIPLLVYNYQYEQDAAKKESKLAELKKKYPNHWLVKDL